MEDEIVEIEIKEYRKNYFGALKGLAKFTEEDRMEDRGIVVTTDSHFKLFKETEML